MEHIIEDLKAEGEENSEDRSQIFDKWLTSIVDYNPYSKG